MTKEITIPQRAKKIAIFAPSYAIGQGDLEDSIKTLQEAGFVVDCPQDLMDPPIAGCV